MDQWCCFVLLLTIIRFSVQDDRLEVETQLGTIRGHYKCSYENRTYAAFEGIPYAKPPVGNLRFAEPEPAEPWSGIFDATIIHECAQYTKLDLADSNEDCLYLNVYVPKKAPISEDSLDVIVFIHGGAFMLGGPSYAGPEFLMDKDIIYVSINYRLGIFGFLSTDDEVVPGNNGLKDQVLALKWVKLNIKHFGGNSNSITIAGMSAGGASVHLHYFSSLAKGLFHRGISHSGTALAPWAICANPLENTLKVAETVGCTSTSTKEIVDCLKTKSAKTLSEATFSTHKFLNFPFVAFAPVIEKTSNTAFLTEHPYKLLQKGNLVDVPWIASISSDESLLIFFMIENFEDIIKEWDTGSQYVLDYFQNADAPDITKKIAEYYFDNSQNTTMVIVKAIKDRLFKIPMLKSLEMQAKVTKSGMYSYVFGYQNDILNNYYKGAIHTTDGLILYHTSEIPKKDGKLSENDEEMKTRLINAITTFAKDGTPTMSGINWEPVTYDKDWGYLHICDADNIAMDYDKDSELMGFWDSLACDYWNRNKK